VTHIAHLIKTSSLVRIFLVVVLSLGMAWLIGSGLRMQSANSATTTQSVPASNSTTGTSLTTGTSTDTQASAAASNTSLDKAVRLLGGVDRARNSTGSSNLAKTSTTKVATGDVTDTNAAANSGTNSKLGTSNVPVVPAK
jgi:hypothetical protein